MIQIFGDATTAATCSLSLSIIIQLSHIDSLCSSPLGSTAPPPNRPVKKFEKGQPASTPLDKN